MIIQNPYNKKLSLKSILRFSILLEFTYLFATYIIKPKFANISLNFDQNAKFQFDLSHCYFFVCYFGKNTINNNKHFRRYFHSLSSSVPGANLIFVVSTFSIVDSSLFNYNLNLKIERFGNETPEYLSTVYPNIHHYYFYGLRYKFFAEYFETHKEIQYAIFTDIDVLFLNNPFLLLKKNPEEVHFMYDIRSFLARKDDNYIWTNIWVHLNDSIKVRCGITLLNKTLKDPTIRRRIPWNSGLLMGKTKNLIPICKLIAKSFFCPGMFDNNAEQGLLNYLYLTGQIFTLGVKFHGHHVINGSLLSCPYLLNRRNFISRMNSSEVYLLHHYYILPKSYVKDFPRLVEFMHY